jgi:class 3 adenylate cyclase/tetratricopeptide (TPR) repeat protein
MLTAMACTNCGRPLPAGARFCPNCGAAVWNSLATDERKMVTVLFADLVDSTGMASRLDPERAREVLGTFFDGAVEELTALRGRPEKFIGDAVMAVFGLPNVHEDDALRAVRAGLAIRARSLRLGETLGLDEPLRVTVGIESGEAATGIGPVGQLLVTGAAVNAAARLQGAASPGEVLAGPTTHTLTANMVSFGRKRRIKAKGFDEPIDSYVVEGLTTRSTRRTIPFVDRVSEQAILGQSLSLASTTGKPVLVTVLGEAGVGKSRLADELAAGLSAGIPILRGQTYGLADTATFSPAAAIVSDLAGITTGDPPDMIRARLHELVAAKTDPEERDVVVERLGLLFGVSKSPTEESAFVHDVSAGFVALIDGLARDHPLVMVFDDAHTLRPAMLDLIERLGSPGRRGPRRALVLVLARNELLTARPGWGSSSGNAVQIRLDPLSRDDSIHLVRHAGGGRIQDPQATEIAKRAGGNPFFIIETTGMLLSDGDGSQATRRLPIPPTVQAVVSSRLDRLSPRLRELARRASVFMYGFDLDELRVVDPEATAAELEELLDAEFLVVDRQSHPAQRWRIRHSMLKEVAYASLPKRERLRLHRLVAKQLQEAGHVSWAADHLELAALASLDLDPSDREAPDAAADALLVAGDRARRRMESRSAVDRYRRGLAMCGPELAWGRREARMLAGMGESYYWLGEYPAATTALQRAIVLAEKCDDAFALALALRFLGDVTMNFEGDVDKAEALFTRSLSAAERLGESRAITRSLLFAGWVPWTRERFEEAEQIWQRALALAEDNDRWARVRALTALSINHGEMKDFDGELSLIEDAYKIAVESGDLFSLGNTSVQKARSLHDLQRARESLPWFDRGIAIFTELGARWELADARAARGIAERDMGRLDEAEEDLRFAIKTAEELGDRQLPSWTWGALAKVSELRGDTVEAAERFRRSREAASRGPH